MKTAHYLSAMLFAAAVTAVSPAHAADKIRLVVFGPPSLGAILPAIIKAKKLDSKNALDLEFVQRPPSAYTAQFNSGEFKVGASAALLTVGLGDVRGVKVSYLFNVFDYYGAVVTSDPKVKSLKDLEGKTLAAAKATTNFRMFQFFAQRKGVDVNKIEVVNSAPPGLIGFAIANRAAAVQLWEPALTNLQARKKDIRVLDLEIGKEWKAFTGSENVPYLGVAAHQDWIKANKALVPKLYQTYADAAAWMVKNPDESAKLVLPKGKPATQKAMADLIKSKDRLGVNLRWAADIRKEIGQVYQAGKASGYLPKDPSAATIYDGK